MTQEQYERLVKYYRLVVEAKKLVKLNKNNTANRIRLVAFKQEAGMYPEDYIERYDHAWKD